MSTTIQAPPNHSMGSPAISHEMTVVLRRKPGGPELARTRLTDADLLDGFSELWLDNILRKGRPNYSVDDLKFRATPVTDNGDNNCRGVVFEAETLDGHVFNSELSIDAIQDVALRLVHQQIEAGALKAQDTYHYDLLAEPRRVAVPETEASPFKVTSKNPPLRTMTLPLAPLLRRATTVGTIDERMMPVFYVQSALAKADRFARKGGQEHPSIETGGAVIGPVCSCPQTGEFFVVVTDVLELVDAEGTKFSLSYTGKTWSRIQVVLRAMQSRPATAAYRILGQAHGHNFLPAGGAPPCEKCHTLGPKECPRKSVFVSLEDRTWTRCVFSRQPWQLCHIFGLNAKKEEVEGLYGLRDNQLQPRGYHVIPDFDPDN